MLQKISIWNKCCSFELSNYIIFLYHFHKSVKQHNIDNNNIFFLNNQISILKWFLKDHVTLGFMDAENSALP